MAKKSDLDEPTRQIAERLINMPPKQHKDMKLGKSKAKDTKERPASKGRVHKGKTRV
jgi:hypothetical protein